MPEKKMLKKSTWFKTKRTSQQNGRTKSVNKNDSCKTFFCHVQKKPICTYKCRFWIFGRIQNANALLQRLRPLVCIPSELFFSEGSSQDNLFGSNSPVSRKVILLLIRIWATLGALPLWPRITSWWDRSKQVFECEWMCMPMRLYTNSCICVILWISASVYAGICLCLKHRGHFPCDPG